MAEAPRRGLGRGLAALLGDAEPLAALGRDAPADAGSPTAPPRQAPVELLRRNPDQPRRRFDPEALGELIASVRQRGVLQPILVRPAPGAPGEWQIVAGERRWRAAQAAGLHEVPILVRDLTDTEVLEIGIVENVQRADLDPVEEAQGYGALIERFGHTQAEVAQLVGKSRSHVTNALRLLQLPPAVQDHLVAGRLSAGHARAIATAPDPVRLAETIVDRGLSVRQAEALGRAGEGSEEGDRTPRPRRTKAADGAKHPDLHALEQDVTEMLGLPVRLTSGRGEAGELTVSYDTLEQLDDVLRRLTGG